MDRPFGATPFANMHAAHHGLPVEPKRRLAHATALHGFDRFRETMRRCQVMADWIFAHPVAGAA